MLDGWRNQQLCRNLDHDTIDWAHGPGPPQDPEKRPFTKQELQDFCDHADDQVTIIGNSYGLRFNELRHVQTVDFSRNTGRHLWRGCPISVYLAVFARYLVDCGVLPASQ